ncbi:invasin, partial [Serratia ureilytica]
MTYAITAGVVAKVELSLDKASYVSGEAMTVTVTLKDAQGNAVSGQADSLKDVAVPNAVLKGAWTETAANSGVYRATYTAKTAGSGLQATLTLNGASATPVTYAITAGVVAKAELSLDKASYVSGEAMTVTATLKDAQGNAVSGQAAGLKDVKVPNAELKGAWTETAANAGVYRATYTAKTAGTGLQATLTLNGASATPATYAITAGVVAKAE